MAGSGGGGVGMGWGAYAFRPCFYLQSLLLPPQKPFLPSPDSPHPPTSLLSSPAPSIAHPHVPCGPPTSAAPRNINPCLLYRPLPPPRPPPPPPHPSTPPRASCRPQGFVLAAPEAFTPLQSLWPPRERSTASKASCRLQ